MSKQKRPDSYAYWMRDIGFRIRWARELVEPNRAAFARAMGVDRSTIQKIEEGDRAPSIWNVIEISQKLRVTPDYILRGSIRGVDGELLYMLLTTHPELMEMIPQTQRNLAESIYRGDATFDQPRIPARA